MEDLSFIGCYVSTRWTQLIPSAEMRTSCFVGSSAKTASRKGTDFEVLLELRPFSQAFLKQTSIRKQYLLQYTDKKKKKNTAVYQTTIEL